MNTRSDRITFFPQGMPTMPDVKFIFDTVSISNFCLADSLHLIEYRYKGKAFISTEVYGEILDGVSSGCQELNSIEEIIRNKAMGILVMDGKEYETYRSFLSNLGKGEASCIAIAKKRNMTVVTDDRAARNRCIEFKVRFTGSIGIIKASVKDGFISLLEADLILSKMIAAGFYSPINNISQIE